MNNIAYLFPVQHLQIHDDIDIAYCETGSGETTLLFVHGLANYLAVWNEQLKVLQKDFHCIAIDLPGNGLSSTGEFPYTMVFYAETIARFIEKKKLQNVVIVGHSMGGQIAMLMALRYPNLTSKLVLVASSGFEFFNATEIAMTEHMLDIGQMWGLDDTYLETSIQQSFYGNNPAAKTIVQELKQLSENHKPGKWHSMVITNIKAMLREPVLPFIDQIKIPVLVIFGEQDAMIPNKLVHYLESTGSIARKANAILENSVLKLIPNAGHFVQLEKAEDTNKSIGDFLANT